MGIKNEARMEKLLQGVTPVPQNFEMKLMPILFVTFLNFQVNKNLTPLLQKCGEKSTMAVH